jgi:hypothetical protein
VNTVGVEGTGLAGFSVGEAVDLLSSDDSSSENDVDNNSDDDFKPLSKRKPKKVMRNKQWQIVQWQAKIDNKPTQVGYHSHHQHHYRIPCYHQVDSVYFQ